MIRLFLVFLCFALPLAAQDRAGNDTPGEWKPTHYVPFGLWDSICDERVTDNVTEQRCYLRYVDVFSLPPNFAAQFVFITRQGGAHKVDFGIERRTRFVPDGFRVTKDGATVWALEQGRCRAAGRCVFDGADAADILARFAAGGDTVEFLFNDRHGVDQHLRWDLSQFSDAMADFTAAAVARGL